MFADVVDVVGDEPIRVLARISVLSTAEGGRQGPFKGPYRPNHNFGDADNHIFHIGRVEVPEGIWVQPGEVVELVITFLNVRGLSEKLTIGRTWRIQEGPRLVATGEILEVLC